LNLKALEHSATNRPTLAETLKQTLLLPYISVFLRSRKSRDARENFATDRAPTHDAAQRVRTRHDGHRDIVATLALRRRSVRIERAPRLSVKNTTL
jgi:hypothetical protein